MTGDEPRIETPTAPPLPGYVLHEPISERDGSVVYRAEPSGRPGRIVAVKRVSSPPSPTALVDLRREGEALRALAHPGVLELLEVVPDGSGLALVLAYAPGGSLAQRLADGALPPVEVAELGARLATTLAAIHRAGLVHGDLKPSNVLFDREDRPLLADLGASRLRGAGPPHAATAGYLAPEVLGGAALDAGADLYALGILLTEALGLDDAARARLRHEGAAATLAVEGQAHSRPRAATGDDPELDALIEAATTGPPGVREPGIEDATAGLHTALAAAIADDPADRPRSAHELAGELEQAHRRLQAAASGGRQASSTDSGNGSWSTAARPGGSRDARGARQPARDAHGPAPTRPFGPRPATSPDPQPDMELAALARWLAVPALLAVAFTPIAVVVWLVLGATST